MSAIVKMGKIHRPKVKEILVIDLTKLNGMITYEEALQIHIKSDWRFKMCIYYPNSKVRKAIFERLT